MSTRLLTTDEVSDRLGIPALTLKDWRYKNRGPAYLHIGRRVMYREQDIEQFIDDAVRTAAHR